MRRRVVRATALLMLPAAACVRVTTTPFAPQQPWAAVPADSVRVFATTTPPHYTEIAVLRSRRVLVASDARVLRALRDEAGKAGANGLLLLNTRGATSASGGITGIIFGRRPSVFSGRADADVDEFQRAVAIRVPPDTR